MVLCERGVRLEGAPTESSSGGPMQLASAWTRPKGDRTGLTMELELAKLLVRRCLRQPLIILAWLALCALPWWLAVPGPLGPDARSLFSSRMIYEVAFVWGLIGGLVALAALGDIATGLDPLGTLRRIRAQAGVLAACILLPGLPIVALGLLPAAREGS